MYDEKSRPCAELRDMAQAHLEAVRVKLQETQRLERTLAAFVDSCNAGCIGGSTQNCTIIGDLTLSPQSHPADKGGGCCAGESIVPSNESKVTELKRD